MNGIDDSILCFAAISIFLGVLLVYCADVPVLLAVAFAFVAFLFMYFSFKYSTMRNVMAVVGVILAILLIAAICVAAGQKDGRMW